MIQITSTQPCYVITTVFDNTKLPKDLCEWHTNYHIPSKSVINI
jgi:hypothetical protein